MSMNGILKMFSIYIFGNFKPLSPFKKFPFPSLFTISQIYNISPAHYQQKNLLWPLKDSKNSYLILKWKKQNGIKICLNVRQKLETRNTLSLTLSLSQHTEQLLLSCLCSKGKVKMPMFFGTSSAAPHPVSFEFIEMVPS